MQSCIPFRAISCRRTLASRILLQTLYCLLSPSEIGLSISSSNFGDKYTRGQNLSHRSTIPASISRPRMRLVPAFEMLGMQSLWDGQTVPQEGARHWQIVMNSKTSNRRSLRSNLDTNDWCLSRRLASSCCVNPTSWRAVTSRRIKASYSSV